jgi:hypothetical protein
MGEASGTAVALALVYRRGRDGDGHHVREADDADDADDG